MSDYQFADIENKWRTFWAENGTNKVVEDTTKPKYYVLDMFPYPSGAGLHVGHPLGYIASDVYARYKKLLGYNVLHPMGYDSFGLPAEQYAIQTGQHPRLTTENNIKRYRDQLDQMGFSFDWSREVRTSSPEYYKWTQWIFIQLFESWYNRKSQKAEPIATLVAAFEQSGNEGIDAESDFDQIFDAADWNSMTYEEQERVLQDYRLAYIADSWVNWCPALGTVLANDEMVNGVSERGGHPVEQKLMRQWSMRIKAYAERLITGLDQLDWSDAIKDIQRNWIGKSQGAMVKFQIENHTDCIEVFTTRPDTIFGVSFMVLAPEHPLVNQITTSTYQQEVEAYQKKAALKTERDRQADVKNISGQFTGAFAIHPFSGEKIQIWIGDYVLASYGTGAVMAVPCGDQRDWDFAKHFNLAIKNIFQDQDVSEGAYAEKDAILTDSDFLNGLSYQEASKLIIAQLEAQNLGKGKINYRLRDAIFSRQRYWGEPFPVYYQNGIPKMIDEQHLPIILPEVENYLPTADGEPPLGNAQQWAWDTTQNKVVSNQEINGTTIFPLELNTMPGWAGSSWYFLRYMDAQNNQEFASAEKMNYWKNVDLYIGGSEHGTGHLLYARFWTKFLFDRNFIQFDEPFQKMINQGMILGRSSFVYRIKDTQQFVSASMKNQYETLPLHVDISLVDNDKLDMDGFKKWRSDFANATFICEEDGTYLCGHEVEKMSKSKFNVQTPDELVAKFGADTLRMYEMFLGPVEQSKPWDTKGINGVHNFLRKVWRLFYAQDGSWRVTEDAPSKESLKTLHKTIKKTTEDLDRFSLNTCVSNYMICVNELTEQGCHSKSILQDFIVLLSPYAPHICEELWEKLGYEKGTASFQKFPAFNPEYLVESNYDYPVSINGKMRLKVNLPLTMNPKEIEEFILSYPDAQKWIDGQTPKKMIIVPGKIINIVL